MISGFLDLCVIGKDGTMRVIYLVQVCNPNHLSFSPQNSTDCSSWARHAHYNHNIESVAAFDITGSGVNDVFTGLGGALLSLLSEDEILESHYADYIPPEDSAYTGVYMENQNGVFSPQEYFPGIVTGITLQSSSRFITLESYV